MAILKSLSGKVEVRLRKPPFDTGEPVFFDEYAELGVRDSGKAEKCSRYIVPKDTTYAIHICIKKGFRFDAKFDRIWVQLFDEASKKRIYENAFHKGCEKWKLEKDQIICITSLKRGVVNGKLKENPKLTFKTLSPDEELSPGVGLPGLGGLRIEIGRINDGSHQPRDQEDYGREIDEYNQLVLAHSKPITTPNLLGFRQKVDLQSYHKDGITHELGLVEGAGTPPSPSREETLVDLMDPLQFKFLCRNPAVFERNSIMKTPIPLEFQPWDYFRYEYQKYEPFKVLQEYDKKATLQQRISEAGTNPNIEAIKKELFDTGVRPHRWIPWTTLLMRERLCVYSELQKRRAYFAKGEYPPDDRVPEVLRKATLLSDKETPKQDPAEVVVKKVPAEPPVFPRTKKPEPVIIDLDDSPPRVRKRPSSRISGPSMKAEMMDLENPTATIKSEHPEGLPTKRIKLEPGVTVGDVDHDKELVRLKEEDELLKQELLAAQRVADLIRERRESKKRIATLEAMNSSRRQDGT